MHPRFSHQEQGSRRRPSRATRGAPQYRESGDGDCSSSSDDETKDYRVGHRKRKSTDRDSDRESDGGDSSKEIEEEEQAPPVHHLGQGMHYGLLEVHALVLPNYVVRVNYKGKGMTERARDQRRIDPRGLPRIQYDHRFHTMFHLDYFTSVILARNPMVAKSQWID